ncbi:hypothetical protein KDA_44550 [Dictyobacter alpinus]|uniref:Uncharacterized protein n=2 Tax=Dictyobacter alpinus TaxID=2014873 RepID=A0A402BC22_9CHLR|nr:hypothetical protein KDA_44550 [Dictyobacter alpinus]
MRLKSVEQILKGQPASDLVRILAYQPEYFGEHFATCLQEALRGESEWSVGERELFASFTSSRLQCRY